MKILLEKGIVCDKCNSYFSKLEQHFIERHPGAGYRLFHLGKTRKGKLPIHLGMSNTATCVRGDPGTKKVNIPLDTFGSELQDNGNIKLTGTFSVLPFDSVRIGRVLAKIALESMFALNSPEFDPYGSIFDDLRKYARLGPGKTPYWWFAWRRPANPEPSPSMRIFKIDGETSLSVSRIGLPGVAYLVPLTTELEASRFYGNPHGWTVVTRSGMINQEPDVIVVTLKKTPLPNKHEKT